MTLKVAPWACPILLPPRHLNVPIPGPDSGPSPSWAEPSGGEKVGLCVGKNYTWGRERARRAGQRGVDPGARRPPSGPRRPPSTAPCACISHDNGAAPAGRLCGGHLAPALPGSLPRGGEREPHVSLSGVRSGRVLPRVDLRSHESRSTGDKDARVRGVGGRRSGGAGHRRDSTPARPPLPSGPARPRGPHKAFMLPQPA